MKKKITKKAKNKSVFISVVVFVGLILTCCIIVLSIKREAEKRATYANMHLPSSQEYYADFPNIAITVPQGYSVKEAFGTITLTNTQKKEITITFTGTNEPSLETYLFEVTDRGKTDIANRKDIIINNTSATKIYINDIPSYIFYKDYSVISVNTKSPDLYNDMDQIARSLRFTR